MKWYLLSFVMGSVIIQFIMSLFIGKSIFRKPLCICIAVTFCLMLPIEMWATNKGIWSWSDRVTLLMVGKIPIEELLLYCTSAVTTVVLFELFVYILKHTIYHEHNNTIHPPLP